jgi:hypothetical protein
MHGYCRVHGSRGQRATTGSHQVRRGKMGRDSQQRVRLIAWEATVLHAHLSRLAVGFSLVFMCVPLCRNRCLPGKTPAQLNLQTQRLLGQQSTAGKHDKDHCARPQVALP